MKRKTKKSKILIIILFVITILVSFFIGKQANSSIASSTTTTQIVETTVSTRTIEKTLSSSGEISASYTEELSLSTSKYFKLMCVESGDAVKEGANILQYSNGTYLTAPYNCVISSYSVPETGKICTSSHYIKVQNLDSLSMTLSINESEINSVKVGQEVSIVLGADETKTYVGEITKIDSIGNYSSSGTTFTAIVTFKNDGNVKIGMTASCTVTLEKQENIMAIPIAAVQSDEDNKYVIVVKEDGTTQNVTIETGISDDSYVQIINGLSGTETIQMLQTTSSSTSSRSSKNSSGTQGMMNSGTSPSGKTGTNGGK